MIFKKLKSLFRPVKKINAPPLPFQPRENDVFIISYPKSGNTWVRFLIGNYITDNQLNFKNAHLIIPDMHFNPAQIEKITNVPRFIKSHLPYHPELKKVIYIVRDGREAAVSLFYYMRKMKEIPFDITLNEFLENYFFSGKTTFGQWDNHVLSWLNNSKSDNLLLVKYEDMIKDTAKELRKMLAFSGLPIDEKKVIDAVNNSSFESMKKDEQQDPNLIQKLGKDSVKTDYGFVRKGGTDSWKEEFTTDEKEKFWKLYSDAMGRLNYRKN